MNLYQEVTSIYSNSYNYLNSIQSTFKTIHGINNALSTQNHQDHSLDKDDHDSSLLLTLSEKSSERKIGIDINSNKHQRSQEKASVRNYSTEFDLIPQNDYEGTNTHNKGEDNSFQSMSSTPESQKQEFTILQKLFIFMQESGKMNSQSISDSQISQTDSDYFYIPLYNIFTHYFPRSNKLLSTSTVQQNYPSHILNTILTNIEQYLNSVILSHQGEKAFPSFIHQFFSHTLTKVVWNNNGRKVETKTPQFIHHVTIKKGSSLKRTLVDMWSVHPVSDDNSQSVKPPKSSASNPFNNQAEQHSSSSSYKDTSASSLSSSFKESLFQSSLIYPSIDSELSQFTEDFGDFLYQEASLNSCATTL